MKASIAYSLTTSCATASILIACGSAPRTLANSPVHKAASCPADAVYVGGGVFMLGSLEEHHMALSNYTIAPFCMSRHAASVVEYKSCVVSGECHPDPIPRTDPMCDGVSMGRPWDREDKDILGPAMCLSYFDALSYCSAHGGRLPDEQEWELAVRGVDGRRYPWGNEAPPYEPIGNWDHFGIKRPFSDTSPSGVEGTMWYINEWTSTELSDSDKAALLPTSPKFDPASKWFWLRGYLYPGANDAWHHVPLDAHARQLAGVRCAFVVR